MKLDQLFLWYLADPPAPRFIGRLHLVAQGRGVSLHYGAQWLKSGFALSEDLPLVDTEFFPRGRLLADTPRAVGAVDDARPDRWGERVIRYIDRPARLSLMEYLYYAGDDRFGALGVSTSDTHYLPRVSGPLPRHDQVQALRDVVAKVEGSEPLSDPEKVLLAAGGSLGGAQPKALLQIGSDEWVIKFRRKDDPLDSPLIEHAAMTLAAQAGIRAAATQVIPLAKGHALAIRRFDREGQLRLHSISAGTALRAVAVDGEEPDLSYPALALLLRRVGVAQDDANGEDARELFRRMVFNVLIDNTDDHEKNHALLVVAPRSHGRYRLSPCFDVLPSAGAHGYQEFACGEAGHDSTLVNAMSRAHAFGLSPAEAASEIAAVIKVVNGWRQHFVDCGVSAADIDSIAQHVDGEALRTQRENFKPAAFGGKGKAKRL